MASSDQERAARDRAEKRYWLDDPRNVERVVYALYTVCGLLLVIDIFVEKHGPWIAHLYAFYAWYGFIGAFALVLAAKLMRRVIMRPEDYYDH